MNKLTEMADGSVRKRPSLALAVAGLILAASIYSNLTHAQGPGGQGGPGGFGQGRRGGGPGGQGGFGGPGGGMPFVMGEITGGDANSGIINVASQFNREQVIRVSAN